MSLGTVLDVVVGLAFTYLLLGIIASGFQEALVGFINKRGQELEKAIYDMLSGGASLDAKVFGHSLVSGLSPGTRSPSYVPARNFALAVLDALREGDQAPAFDAVKKAVGDLPDGKAKQSLTTFVNAAGNDLATLQKSIETWFDDAMDRVSGIYKRYSQCFTLLFGLAAAVLFNVDSINLANTLWTNGPRRDAAITAAQQYVSNSAKTPSATQTAKDQAQGASQTAEEEKRIDAQAAKDRVQIDKSVQDATGLLNKLPIGWVATPEEKSDGKKPNAWSLFWDRLFAPDGSGVWILLGWLITGLATSLGAPFWFDALSNLLRLRSAGPKPKRSDDPATTGA